ncbi:LysE family translocator [Kiloniella antarctica]|uniref:LysE family translocator n=1 Tax=Kiloniella antarctica TaxID=1550907 RepID=A0ABW5BJD8_9PROT
MDPIASYLPGILLAFGAFSLGMLSPGPNIMSVIGTSMSVGRKSGKALALGVATGTFFWGLLAFWGFTTVLSLYASVMFAIKIFGATYLLWLAFKSFRSATTTKKIVATDLGITGRPAAYYRRGLLIQMTNPKAALTWVAVMSLAVDASAPLWVGCSIVFGTTLISIFGHMTYAIAFSTAPMVGAYQKARRWIEAGLGAFFCFASYKILTSKS